MAKLVFYKRDPIGLIEVKRMDFEPCEQILIPRVMPVSVLSMSTMVTSVNATSTHDTFTRVGKTVDGEVIYIQND
jgi:hypothetical protein